jgi:hypothetical protein
MDLSEQHRHVLEAVQRHAVSACECAVLLVVNYRMSLPPNGVAGHAKLFDDLDGNPYGVFSLDDYLRAVDRCVHKGWLTILPPDHAEREERRRRLSTVPEVIDESYRAGDVDFTEGGFPFFRALLCEVFGPDIVRRSYAGWNWDDSRHAFDVYAEDEELCRSAMERVEREGVNPFGGGLLRVAGVEGPAPIGPWKPDRFIMLPSGFHAVLKVELHAQPTTREGEAVRSMP